MAKAEQENIEALSGCGRSGGDSRERVGYGESNEGLASRTYCRNETCRNEPNERVNREIGSREFPKNYQNSHGMDCDGSCHIKSEPILNNVNEVVEDLATKLKEKLNLNGISISQPSSSLTPQSDCIDSVHEDQDAGGSVIEMSPPTESTEPEQLVSEPTPIRHDSHHHYQTTQIGNLHNQQRELPFEYELPENIREPPTVADRIPETDEDIDVINGNTGESSVRLIAYESEKQIQSIMALITKDLSEPYSIYTYRYFIHNWPSLCFLAMHEETCVGAIVCKLDSHKKLARRGYIAMLAVDEAFRKRKIGSNLVIKAIRTMLRSNCDEVVLETEITNKPALRLYENLGFVRDKRLFRYYLNGVDALRLKLWLK